MLPADTDTQNADSKIVLIEDNQVVGEFVKTTLKNAGFANIQLFTDPSDAIVAMKQATADLVITDIYMPRMNGFAVTKLLRQMPGLKSTPIVVVTADQTARSHTELQSIGVSAILPKPVDASTLVKTVRQHLDSRIDSGNKGTFTPASRSFKSGQLQHSNQTQRV